MRHSRFPSLLLCISPNPPVSVTRAQAGFLHSSLSLSHFSKVRKVDVRNSMLVPRSVEKIEFPTEIVKFLERGDLPASPNPDAW